MLEHTLRYWLAVEDEAEALDDEEDLDEAEDDEDEDDDEEAVGV